MLAPCRGRRTDRPALVAAGFQIEPHDRLARHVIGQTLPSTFAPIPASPWIAAWRRRRDRPATGKDLLKVLLFVSEAGEPGLKLLKASHRLPPASASRSSDASRESGLGHGNWIFDDRAALGFEPAEKILDEIRIPDIAVAVLAVANDAHVMPAQWSFPACQYSVMTTRVARPLGRSSSVYTICNSKSVNVSSVNLSGHATD